MKTIPIETLPDAPFTLLVPDEESGNSPFRHDQCVPMGESKPSVEEIAIRYGNPPLTSAIND